MERSIQSITAYGEPTQEPALSLVRELRGQVERRRWYHETIANIPNKRVQTGSREALIRHVLATWVSVGNDPGRARNDAQPEPFGPVIDFALACVEPAFGPTKRNAIDFVIRKMNAEGAFGKIDRA